MKNYKQLIKELPSKSVVFAFGRFNPPTTGHELLFKAIKKIAQSHGADHIVYASRSQDKKKNPLPVARKIHYLNLMFPGINFVAANEEIRTFLEVAKQLNKKYKNIIMVAGSDRVQEYTKLLNNYNGKEYKFDTIQVISAGERDPDSDDASGMSASKMRAAATKGDYKSFKQGLPSSVRDLDGKLLMNELRQGMGLDGIKEQVKFSVDELREKYFKGEIYHIGEVVESEGIQYEIMDRGSNYLTLIDESGNMCKKWIKDVSIVEEKKGLWANIHAKRKRIKAGSKERMRKPGSEGAPTAQDFKDSQVKEDIQPGYAPAEISFKGYTTKNLHHSGDAAKAFQETIQRYGQHDPVAVLNALKATDTYMKLNDMHLEQGKAPDDSELKQWRDAHTKARESLQRIGEFQHHMDYWHNHDHEIQDMEADYTPATAGADMAEETNYDLSNKTIKPSDKLKVARIIGSFLSVDKVESLSSPEQIINMGLRKVRSKPLNAESISILTKMLGLATEVGIEYDNKLTPQKIKESIDSRVTVDKKSSYNAAKDVMRYSDFKKLMKMNKGEVAEATIKLKKDGIVTDDDDTDPYDYDDKVAGDPDTKEPDTGEQVPAVKIAYHDLENKGPIDSEVGSTLGHGSNSQLRRAKVNYQREDVATAEYTIKKYIGSDGETHQRKIRPHRVTFAASKGDAEPVQPKQKDEEVDTKKKLKKDYPIKADALGGGSQNKGFDAFFEETEESEELSDQELDAMAAEVKDVEDVIDAYDDHELAIVDEDGEEVESDLKEEMLNEVLSRMERIKAKVRFARTKSKRERKVSLALKRHSDTSTINKRARRLAINLMKKRIAKKPLNKLSVAEKERLEKMIARRKTVINRLAMRLTSRVRKIENDRLAHHKYTKK
jgi:nicotinic acid mononucleotide adenylyltransferase